MTSCSTNRFVISKSKIQGYLAIYFMLISNQSNFSEIYMTPYRTVIMAGLLCVFLFTAKKGIKTYCTLFFAFLIMYALLIRLSVGGILSTQSTTGYISICFIILFYLLFEKRDTTEQNWKQKILIALFSILLFLMIDYMVRGSESFIQVSIISKLFSSKNKVCCIVHPASLPVQTQ